MTGILIVLVCAVMFNGATVLSASLEVDILEIEGNFDFPGLPEINQTLDEIDEIDKRYWLLPKKLVPKWMEYHTDIESFISEMGNVAKCPNVTNDVDMQTLSNVAGIWAACQDPRLPEGCENVPDFPCYPVIEYRGEKYDYIRTIKVSFALFGLALLRIETGSLSYGCFEYGLRKDPFSPCEFIHLSSEVNGWRQLVFTYDYEEDISFTSFRIQLISRFAKDVILIDKIESTSLLLCEDGITLCPIITTTITPTDDTGSTETTLETTQPTSTATIPTASTSSTTIPTASTSSTTLSTTETEDDITIETTEVTEEETTETGSSPKSTTTEPDASSTVLFNPLLLILGLMCIHIQMYLHYWETSYI